ncbi:MAG: hypothetical protein IPG25_13920 [Proteobacteria bacterium]|nr:hypothetical protein [Pseudomonadota bacterium]
MAAQRSGVALAHCDAGATAAIVDAFSKSLLAQYGDALVSFTSDRYEVLPSRINTRYGCDRASQPRSTRSNGEQIPC